MKKAWKQTRECAARHELTIGAVVMFFVGRRGGARRTVTLRGSSVVLESEKNDCDVRPKSPNCPVRFRSFIFFPFFFGINVYFLTSRAVAEYFFRFENLERVTNKKGLKASF